MFLRWLLQVKMKVWASLLLFISSFLPPSCTTEVSRLVCLHHIFIILTPLFGHIVAHSLSLYLFVPLSLSQSERVASLVLSLSVSLSRPPAPTFHSLHSPRMHTTLFEFLPCSVSFTSLHPLYASDLGDATPYECQ